MSSNYRDRLEELETLVLERRHTIDNLSGVPFVVFPFPPEKELSVEEDIDAFVEKLRYNDLSVTQIDLRDLVFTILQDQNLLESVIEVEKETPEDLREGLNSTFFEEFGANRGTLIGALVERVEEHDVAVVHRCGILHPFSSISVVLGQLENVIDTPLIVFYPAVKQDKNLRFLDETDGTYYRARVI